MAIATFAAIDIRSYEVGLKIFEVSRKGMKEIDYLRKNLEIGKETYVHGKMNNDLLEELIDILNDFRRKMDEYHVDAYRACSTSALRETTNMLLVLDKIYVRTGLKIDVLSNSEQRFLGYKAIASIEDSFEQIIAHSTAIVDVGGGSVQISLFDKDSLVTTQNMKIGALRIHERLAGVENRTTNYAAVVGEMVSNELKSFKKMYMKDKQIENLILTGDYVTEFLSRQAKAHGSSMMSADEFNQMYQKIASVNSMEMAKNLGLPLEHASLILPSMVLYKRFLDETGALNIWLPGLNLCDGIAFDYAQSMKIVKTAHNFDDDIVACAKNISKRYLSNKNHIQGTEDLALTIFDKMKSIHGLGARERLMLQIAVILHDCGKFINMNRTSECSFNIIMNTEIIGLSHKEREIIAYAVRFNTRDFADYEEMAIGSDLEQSDYLLISKISAILRVANAMDRSHKQKFKNVKVALKDRDLIVTVDTPEDITLEKGLFSDKAEFFETVFSIRPVIRQKKQF